MSQQGTKTTIEPGIVARVAAGLGLMITGKAPDWFGPQQPLAPVVPENQKESVTGRQFDYQVGYNLQTRPRTGEAITFDQMRALADNYDILRLVIETRKDQMEKLQWTIKPRDQKAKPDARCDELIKFFKKPDREHNWTTWLRMLLEDLLVIDAPAIYIRPTVGGSLYALEPLDGATVKPVIDERGRRPAPPDTAYQQILKGVPAVDYTSDELIYRPRNRRTHKVYGYSPVEQIILTINIALRRQVNQLSYYTEGNVPNLLFQVPKEWNPEQIKAFQLWWDEVTQGQSKHYGRFIPDGAAPVEIKQPPLKDMYDEWLARVVCFCFSIEPTPFVAQVNRAVAETSRQQSLAEGLAPLKNWVADLIDDIISERFGIDDLGFAWVDEEVTTPKEKAEITAIYVREMIITPDEARADMGRDPLTPEERSSAWPAPLALPAPGVEPDEDHPPDKIAKPKETDDKEAVTKAKKALRPIDRDRPEVGRWIEKVEETIAGFFEEQAPEIAKQLSELISSSEKTIQAEDWSGKALRILSLLKFDAWEFLAGAVGDLLVAVAVDGGGEGLKQVGIEDDDVGHLMRQRAEAWAKERAAELVGMKYVEGELIPNPNAKWQITEGTRQWLKGITEQALSEGWSSQKTAAAISADYAFSKERATMIARTEVARADIAGSVEGWKASGLVSEKEWLTAPDCCDECQEMDGKTAPLNESFEDGKDCPLHPHCRCDLLPVLSDDKTSVAKSFNPDQPRDENGRWTNSTVATLTGNELGEYASTKDLRKAAMAHAETNLIGKTFTNAESGHEIKVTRQGVKHSLSKANPVEIKMIPAMGDVLRGAKHIESVPDKLQRTHILAAHKYSAVVSVGGEMLKVGIVTLEKAGGIEHYDHFVLKDK